MKKEASKLDYRRDKIIDGDKKYIIVQIFSLFHKIKVKVVSTLSGQEDTLEYDADELVEVA